MGHGALAKKLRLLSLAGVAMAILTSAAPAHARDVPIPDRIRKPAGTSKPEETGLWPSVSASMERGTEPFWTWRIALAGFRIIDGQLVCRAEERRRDDDHR